jgi:hypothetical protein
MGVGSEKCGLGVSPSGAPFQDSWEDRNLRCLVLVGKTWETCSNCYKNILSVRLVTNTRIFSRYHRSIQTRLPGDAIDCRSQVEERSDDYRW